MLLSSTQKCVSDESEHTFCVSLFKFEDFDLGLYFLTQIAPNTVLAESVTIPGVNHLFLCLMNQDTTKTKSDFYVFL